MIRYNLLLLEEKAKSTLTLVIISNLDKIKELVRLSGRIVVGETLIIRIRKLICSMPLRLLWTGSKPIIRQEDFTIGDSFPRL